MHSHLSLCAMAVVTASVVVAGGARNTAKAVTSPAFDYSTPQTGYYGLDPLAFSPEDGFDDTYFKGDVPDALYDSSGFGRCFATGLNLPQGAKITALNAWYSSDTNGNIKVFVSRNRLTDGKFDYVATSQSTDTTMTRQRLDGTVRKAIAIVDNEHFTYSAGLCFGTSGTNSRYYGGRITFIYGNAGD
jgi:hypothetical protein